MQIVQLRDKSFVRFISQQEIEKRICILAKRINDDYTDKDPLFIVVLNGSFMFAADLLRHIQTACEVSFVKFSSYEGMKSSGEVTSLIGLERDVIKNRHIIVIEDIVDTGLTVHTVLNQLKKYHPSSIALASLLFKPDALQKNIKIDYLGFEIDNKFVVGYGLDYDGHGRNLKHIYRLQN